MSFLFSEQIVNPLQNRFYQIFCITFPLIFFFIGISEASFPPCEGDFDNDQNLDGSDLSLFIQDYNRTDCHDNCNGDFYSDGDVDIDDMKILAADFGRSECSIVNYKVNGLNFSPYMDGQDPNLGSIISEEQIQQRLQAIAPYTLWIRSFGMTHGLEHIGRLAHEMSLKAAVGAWLGKDMLVNSQQMNNLIDAARNGDVDLAIIGSEVLLRGDMSESELLSYINQFKEEVPGIPVTTADIYSILLAHPDLMAASDVIFVNYYPYWEGKDVNYSVANVHALHQEMMEKANGKEVIVSETGWPSDGDTINEAVPTLDNACFYNLNIASWAQAENVKYFIFEAFDETWKAAHEGLQGAHWGVWDKDGNLKTCMSDFFEGVKVSDNWTCMDVPGGPGDAEIVFLYVPLYGSFDNLSGQIWHVDPNEYKVSVYIRIGSSWWTKPYFAAPLTSIECDGTWSCDITTGGIDEQANTIAAFLVPKEYVPPPVGGASVLPAEISENSIASAEITRTP
ncbi:MAG: hypothetical protein KQH63_04900 [Desulfobulbaceae bacterium]|nr:hypothetical protein [Desulfobulbaceae bacterium]